MSAKEIEKKIKWYTRCKFLILGILIVSAISFIIDILTINNEIFGLISYFVMILTAIVAYMFPINIPLSKNTSIQDYEGILEYLANIPDDMGKQRYVEGLVMIKNSLDEIVHYQMKPEINEDIRDCICYLQGKFQSEDRKCIIPMKLYDRLYVRNICKELQQEVENVKFNPKNLDNIQSEDGQAIKRKIHIAVQDICNIILICLVIYKLVMSINDYLYNSMNYNIINRLLYNVGADVLTVALAISTYLHSKRNHNT